ncbi:MAG: hypothetical protein D8M58_10960 [Calditrichaeota bacterium]|nr:MAG: hypothetical protein DWQ03_10335 [Calditrichota bacterium]MBL1205912.1 hypothetical protein [Calditrichota bacterium]NOG45740.1 hypothetical protein [Calditrichota bacterium]
MFERDFILRMIKQLAQVIGQVLNYKKKGQWENAQMVVDVATKQLLGINPEIVERLDADALIELFTYDGETDYDKCMTLAVLLTEQGEIFEHRGQDTDKIFRQYFQGFHLFEIVFQEQQKYKTDYVTYALFCCEKLTEFKIAPELLFRIFKFYKNHNYFAKAENILFLLLEQNENDAKKHAINFYKQLLSCDDKLLNKGELPRDEVIEGLEKLTKS